MNTNREEPKADVQATDQVVAHWHVTESNAGCLPEAEAGTYVDAESALDNLAHLLKEWADTYPDPEDPDAVYADGVAERFCTCKQSERSAEHHDALTALRHGRGLVEHVGRRVFELTNCREKDCLKYCPNADCGTVTPVGDTDHRCWCCGAGYVDWEACVWLAGDLPRDE